MTDVLSTAAPGLVTESRHEALARFPHAYQGQYCMASAKEFDDGWEFVTYGIVPSQRRIPPDRLDLRLG
jgi:hypothetical protein